jgi:ribosomal protein S19E (S16A)
MKFRGSPASGSIEQAAEIVALRAIEAGGNVSTSSLLMLKKRGLVEDHDGKVVVTEQGRIQMMFAAAR